MYRERVNSASGCAPMIIVVAVLVFIAIAVWWIESRFGSTTAILVIGGLFGVMCLIVGYVLSMANTKYTMASLTEFNRDLAESERYRQMTTREQVKGDAAMQKAHAALTVLDAKRVDTLAQQRANLLIDAERQQREQGSSNSNNQRQIPQWGIDDGQDNNQYQTWD